MSKKKILYLITQSELGGAQKYVADLVKNLKDKFEISVAFGEQGEKGELTEILKSLIIKQYVIKNLKRKINYKQDLLAILEIKKIIKKIKPDIVHLNSSKVSILGSIATFLNNISPFRKKVRVVYTAHGWVFTEPLPKKEKKLYTKIERFTARWKNKIICVSEFDHQIALKESIAPEKKLITIHNGIEQINLLPKEEAKEKLIQLNSKFEIRNSKLLIGSIGNLYQTKGYDYLIKAIKILVDRGMDLKLIIIGSGPKKIDLKNWIDQLYLNKNVFLTGRIKNGSELLPAFDLYVCSSVKEGLSYTIIEAMSAGLPIIATKVGGNSELISDKKEGVLIKSQSEEEIARAIIKFYNNPQEHKQMGDSAREKFTQKFSLEKMVEKTKNIYNSL